MEQMIPEKMAQKIGAAGVMAVLVIDNPEDAVPLARTLLENGISAMELTLRTNTALESLRRIRSEVPEMLAGVGTILTPGQVREVISCGAEYGVSPGLNRSVVQAAATSGFPFSPGISTPSEIETALELGCHIMKFFHAEQLGGVEYLKGINAPYGFLNLKYIPLGGLNLKNIDRYLELPEILALGGTWIAPRELIREKNWSTIARNAEDTMKVLKRVRG